jgi:filamentous hemagglutinin
MILAAIAATCINAFATSDYLLQALSIDPASTQKRLGDGFVEQKLIREQVALLTGQRFLGDYSSDQAQYQALMNNAATFAQAHSLRPGIALSAEQVAQLTSDIVWLVEQEVTLPGGAKTKALVPKVYVKVRPGDLDGSGALLSADIIKLGGDGATAISDLQNTGTIAGRKLVSVDALNVTHLGGRITGQAVVLNAQQDIRNTGGTVDAGRILALSAGRNVSIETTTSNITSNSASISGQGIDRIAGLYVTDRSAGGMLIVNAGGSIDLKGAQMANASQGSQTLLVAGGDITLSTVQTQRSESIHWSANNHRNESRSEQVGSQVNAAGDITLVAGGTLSARAAQVQADGALSAKATDILIQAGQRTSSLDEASQRSTRRNLSRTTTTARTSSESASAIESSLGGQTVTLDAGRDIGIQGSSVIADNNVTMLAERNITLEAAQNTQSSSSFNETRRSGLMSAGGSGIFIGSQQQSTDTQTQSVTQTGSTVGTIGQGPSGSGGNVTLLAGQTYTQRGSDVLTPGGDIAIVAQNVNILEARETARQSIEQRSKQSGLSVSAGGGVIDTLQGTAQALQGATSGGSERSKALNALIAYGKGSDLLEQGKGVVNAAQQGGASGAAAASGVKVSISVGSSNSQANSTRNSDTAAGSTIKAGGNVAIRATEGDLTAQGSQVQAGRDLALSAAQNINLLASADTESSRSTNKSSSASVGVSFGVGTGSAGLSVDIAASKGKGQANSDSTSYTNSQIQAGQKVSISSGADTYMVGASIKAGQVTASVGGNLLVQSLQDTASSAASQKTTGVALSIPITGAAGSASISQSKQNSNSNYASVNEQSGIQAGDGGFQVNVKNHTDLKGAVIGSTASADKNSLSTQTLTTSDISNSMSASASSSGMSVGTHMLDGKYASAKAVAGNAMNKGAAKQSDASTTTTAISAAQVTVNGKTTDTSKDPLADSNGKAVSTDAGNTNRTLAKADVAGLQQQAQQKQADNMLVFKAAVAVSDPINKAMTADKKIILQTCQPDGQCEQKRVDANDVKIGPDGKVYVFNNGIMNTEQQALDNAVKQSRTEANSQGVYVIINPHTGNPVSEIIYAGIDKLNEMLGAVLPISNASQANIDVRNAAQVQGGQVVEVDHSRGSLTGSNATAEQINQGVRNAPIDNVTFNGAAANAQRMADRVNTVTGGTGTVQQATHKDDKIGTVIGGNAPTGGRDASVGNAHTNYGPGVPQPNKDKVWGNDVGSVPVVVQPGNDQGGAK